MKHFNQQLVMQLAEQAGLISNIELPQLKGQGAWPWHRKQLYEFAELVIANQTEILKPIPDIVA